MCDRDHGGRHHDQLQPGGSTHSSPAHGYSPRPFWTCRFRTPWHRRQADTSVHLVQLGWGEQASAVREGRVDASFVRPPVSDLDGLQLTFLYDEPRVAVLPLGNGLAGRSEISIDELDGEVQISVDDDVDPAWFRWWSCDPRPSGAPVRYGQVIHTTDEMLMLAAGGQAIAITPESVAMNYQRPDVAFVSIADIEPCPVSLCSRRDDPDPLVEALRRVVHVSVPVKKAAEALHANHGGRDRMDSVQRW
ncbi:LysR family substrate-binding domain-containing protein [Rhodococcus koreensis]